MQPKGRVKIKWSPEFTYAIGLFTADGCLSKNGRHLDFTSKDKDQVENFHKCLDLGEMKIGTKNNSTNQKAYRVQFGDVIFYRFLEKLGLTPAKSKSLKKLDIPDVYMRDFIRGFFDGDGCSYSFWDKRWKSSFMFYITFTSASNEFLHWFREYINRKLHTTGQFYESKKSRCSYIKYAKRDSLKICEYIYYKNCVCLDRKRLKIDETLRIINH